MAVTIGVLALQGGFLEHLTLLRRAAAHLRSTNPPLDEPSFTEVRTAEDLSRCDALVIPGGESTTIALSASRSGLLEPLRNFVKVDRKPTWGTCAGLILLSEAANATKKGGQELIGGLDVRVHRNYFGRQIESFVADVDLPFLARLEDGDGKGHAGPKEALRPFPGVFIRAPVVEELLPVSEGTNQQGKGPVEVLAVVPGRTLRAKSTHVGENAKPNEGSVNDIVAVMQGNVVGTSFHPELTDDIRVHLWWLGRVLGHAAGG